MNDVDKELIEKLKLCSSDELIKLNESTKLGNRIVDLFGISMIFIILNFPIITLVGGFIVYFVANIGVYLSNVSKIIQKEIDNRINS